MKTKMMNDNFLMTDEGRLEKYFHCFELLDATSRMNVLEKNRTREKLY